MFLKRNKKRQEGPEIDPGRGFSGEGPGMRGPGPIPPEMGEVEDRFTEPYHRSVSKWYIVLSVLYVLIGIVMLVWPKATVGLLGIAIGVGMLAAGITRIVIYFTRNHLDGIMEMNLTLGVTFSAFGAFMLIHRDTVETMLPFAVAILLLIGAISKLQYALDMKELHFTHWKVFLIFTLLIMTLGGILICNPFTGHVLLIYMAISLIIEGVLNIFAVLAISLRVRKIKRGSFVVTEESASSMAKKAAAAALNREEARIASEPAPEARIPSEPAPEKLPAPPEE